jgi:hypothetical protein
MGSAKRNSPQMQMADREQGAGGSPGGGAFSALGVTKRTNASTSRRQTAPDYPGMPETVCLQLMHMDERNMSVICLRAVHNLRENHRQYV